jgi:hypothetical protein
MNAEVGTKNAVATALLAYVALSIKRFLFYQSFLFSNAFYFL